VIASSAKDEGATMNATASGTIRDRRTAVIETAIDIARPAEEVFGYCSDHAHEIEWNPACAGWRRSPTGPSAPEPGMRWSSCPAVP
jgi:hypothetical protein